VRTEAPRRARAEVLRLASTSPNVIDLLCGAVEALRETLPVDGWCGLVLDPANAVKTASVHRAGLSSELTRRALDLEYGHEDVNQFADLARAPRPAAVLHQSCASRPQRSARYRDVLVPAGYQHELRLVLRDRGKPWGGFVFLRERRSAPFTAADVTFLAALSSPLAKGVRRALLRTEVDAGQLPHHPGLLIVNAEHQIEAITPGTQRMLAGVIDEPLSTARLPVALQAIVHSVVASARPAPVQARVPTRQGPWITVYGWRLADEPLRVALSIERSRAEDFAGLVLDGYGLSQREREVTDQLVAGRSTAEIASSLFLSPHTVRDHVKAIFTKSGTRSRRQLVAAVYRRHHLPKP
jgi:DNA-binding CsgD family transcriptional regulator